MEAKDDVELISLAIQRIMECKRGLRDDDSGDSFVGDEEDQLLLPRLLSQLESLKEDNTSKQLEPTETKDSLSSAVVKEDTKDETDKGESCSVNTGGMRTEEIVKELRKLSRQNSITHWLLSIMIVITAVWQLSKVSIILIVKNKLSHPFRFFGSMISGVLNHGDVNVVKGSGLNEFEAALKRSLIKPHSLPSINITELLQMDLSVLGLNGED